ncbi:MAG: caspase family protein [Bacteroidota bacterium]
MKPILLLLAVVGLCGSGCHAPRTATGVTNPVSLNLPPALLFLKASWLDSTGNRFLAVGEPAAVILRVENTGGRPARSVFARLSTPPDIPLRTDNPMGMEDIQPGSHSIWECGIRLLLPPPGESIPLVCEAFAAGGLQSQAETLWIPVGRPGAAVPLRKPAPPLIQISPPLQGKPRITVSAPSLLVEGTVRDSTGVTQVWVGGEPASLRPVDGGVMFSRTVPLGKGANTIPVAALGGSQERSSLILHVMRLEDADTLAGISAARYHALLIAVGNYDDPRNREMEYPLKDARELSDVLRKSYRFERADIRILPDPTRTELLQELEKLALRLTDRDNLLIFFAGHGEWDERKEQGYWLPRDASSTNRSLWVSNADIRDHIRGMRARHVLLIADACFGGSLVTTRQAGTPSSEVVQELYRIPSRHVLTSGALEPVPVRSPFVRFLLKALKENREEYLFAEKLYMTIKLSVIHNSPNRQKPQFGILQESGDEGGGDFIFIRR